MTLFAVRWSRRDGSTAEWHYGRRDAADERARELARGWRKDAHVVRLR